MQKIKNTNDITGESLLVFPFLEEIPTPIQLATAAHLEVFKLTENIRFNISTATLFTAAEAEKFQAAVLVCLEYIKNA